MIHHLYNIYHAYIQQLYNASLTLTCKQQRIQPTLYTTTYTTIPYTQHRRYNTTFTTTHLQPVSTTPLVQQQLHIITITTTQLQHHSYSNIYTTTYTQQLIYNNNSTTKYDQ